MRVLQTLFLLKVDRKAIFKNKNFKFFKKEKILVRDLTNYGMKQFFRVSIGSSDDLKKFLIELRNSVRNNA